jgi:hypothetical protein
VPVGPVAGVIQIDPAFVRAATQAAAGEGMSDALAQAVLQAEQTAGRGGGGGGHGGHKAAIDAITRIAAGVNAKPKQRVKSPAERQAEIEKMKREQQQNPQQRDLTDEQPEERKNPYEQNPLLSLF